MVSRVAAACLAALVVLTGCEAADNQVTKNATMGPGKHKVTKPLRGLWKADDAGPGCKWVVNAPDGGTVLSGAYRRGNESQAVILGTGNLGMTFWPNDACGTWRR